VRNGVIVALLMAMVPATTPAWAQLGGLRDAARRAQEELRKKQEAEAQAKKDEEARKAEEAKKAEPAAPAPATAPAPAPAPATAAQTPAPAGQSAADAPPSFQAFSRFDFVPGERVVGFDDFSQDAIGDFPARWNTNASGEIVTVGGRSGRWLKLTRAGFFIPELAPALPDNFTLEFDLLVPPGFNSGYLFNASIVELGSAQPATWQSADNRFTFTAWPSTATGGQSTMEPRQNDVAAAALPADTKQFARNGAPVHIAVWRQGARVRVYFNEDKVWDVPRAFLPTAKYDAILFFVPNVDASSEYFVSNVRLAVGAPDTRNKLLTDGKWVTHGILFDVNSASMRAESYGTLKEIAGVLQENAALKVQIVGHTDSDGDTAANLDLSRRRAASVRDVLAKEFSIDAGRLDTDGKGEAEPIDKNETPAGKANNRRVEFIRR
jgi:outer membrane protein OmpA-like peptidoglycan-associated protein